MEEPQDRELLVEQFVNFMKSFHVKEHTGAHIVFGVPCADKDLETVKKWITRGFSDRDDLCSVDWETLAWINVLYHALKRLDQLGRNADDFLRTPRLDLYWRAPLSFILSDGRQGAQRVAQLASAIARHEIAKSGEN